MINQNMTNITYIIPVYNSGNVISKLLSTLVRNIDNDDSIIVIDDGSTDNTVEQVTKFTDNRINLEILAENKGVSFARNCGIDLSKSKYIMFVDSDDSLSDNFFSEIKKIVRSNRFPDIVRFSNSGFTGSWPSVISEVSFDSLVLKGYKDSYYLHSCWGQLVKRDFLIKSKVRFDEQLRFGEDFLFSYFLLRYANSIIVVPDKFYQYNITDESVSNTLNPIAITKRISSLENVYSQIFNSVESSTKRIFEKKFRRELSMQLLKTSLSGYNEYSNIVENFRYLYKTDYNYELKYSNIYDLHWILLISKYPGVKFTRRIFTLLYKTFILLKRREI